MRLPIIIFIILLIPFLLNLWYGYLKPAQNGKFQQVDCSMISNTLNDCDTQQYTYHFHR